jgi:hypothetical protein
LSLFSFSSSPPSSSRASKLGGDVVTPLIMSCSTLVDSYVHFCQASGYAEDRCFGDLKVIVEDVLKQTPH